MKLPAFYIEKSLGLLVSILSTIIVYYNWGGCSFICTVNFFDQLITISTTLFGFLLTVLTLIIQSESQVILRMKRHGSFRRLIVFNKNVVLLSALVCILSLVLNSSVESLTINAPQVLKWLGLIDFCLFIWAVTETFIFVFIFYKLLISDNNR